MQIGIKLSQGRLLTRCTCFADNDPKLSYKLQLQSNPTSAPYHLGRRGAPVASSRSRGILSRKGRCPKCELRREGSPDRSEVPADHVKFVKNDACTTLASHLTLSPPRREAACLTAEKRRWKMVVAGPSKMPKNFPIPPHPENSAERN